MSDSVLQGSVGSILSRKDDTKTETVVCEQLGMFFIFIYLCYLFLFCHSRLPMSTRHDIRIFFPLLVTFLVTVLFLSSIFETVKFSILKT